MTREVSSSDAMLVSSVSDDKHMLCFEDPIRKLIALKGLLFHGEVNTVKCP